MFQSTLPMKGVTRLAYAVGVSDRVSIHTPNEGSDLATEVEGWVSMSFQSTLPMKGVTWQYFDSPDRVIVSIHTPNEGSDLIDCPINLASCCFNPHSQ